MAPDAHPELGQETARHRPGGHPGGGLARAGALEDVAGVRAIVLQEADQVGVPRPRQVHPAQRLVVGVGHRLHGHGGPPVVPVPVHDPHGQGRAQGLSQAHAAEDLAGVLLDGHAPAAAVAPLAAGQIAGDVERLQRESRRHALDDDQHPLAVGLAGRREPKVGQHAAITPRPRPPRHRPFAPRPMVTRVPRGGKRAGRPTRGAPAGPCAGVDGSRSVRSHVGIRRPVRGRPVPDDVRRHEDDQIPLLLVV